MHIMSNTSPASGLATTGSRVDWLSFASPRRRGRRTRESISCHGYVKVTHVNVEYKSLSYTRKNCFTASFYVYWLGLSTRPWKVSRSSISTGLMFASNISLVAFSTKSIIRDTSPPTLAVLRNCLKTYPGSPQSSRKNSKSFPGFFHSHELHFSIGYRNKK